MPANAPASDAPAPAPISPAAEVTVVPGTLRHLNLGIEEDPIDRTMPMQTPHSQLNQPVRFAGSIQQSTGGLTLAGDAEATITLADKEAVLCIAEGATLQGDARAARAVVRGSFDGKLSAGVVSIERTAVTNGEIAYGEISMAGGRNSVTLTPIDAPSHNV